MNLKNIYFSSDGRLSRLKFFLYELLIIPILIIVSSFVALALRFLGISIISIYLSIIINVFINWLWLYLLVMLIYKREHDINSDGRYRIKLIILSVILFYFVSLFESLIVFWSFWFLQYVYIVRSLMFIIWICIIFLQWPLLFKSGVIWDNKYGPDPLEKIKNSQF